MTGMLILHQGALGDLILSLPALASLRAHFGPPLWLAAPWPRGELALAAGLADHLIDSDHPSLLPLLWGRGLPLPPVPPLGRAALFTTQPHSPAQRALLLAGWETLILPPFPPPSLTMSVRAWQRLRLEGAGIPWVDTFSLGQSPLRDHTPPHNGPLVALHPGSGSPSKIWAPSEQAALCRRLLALGVQPLLLFGPADTDIEAALTARLPPLPTLHGGTPLQVAGTLLGASAYVGCDSGVTHLAADLGIPTIAVFGPTDPLIWAPEAAVALAPPMECAPCGLENARTCPHRRCLEATTADQVLPLLRSPLHLV